MRPLGFDKQYGAQAQEEALLEARRIVELIEQRSREERGEQEIEVAGGVHWMIPVRVSEDNLNFKNSRR